MSRKSKDSDRIKRTILENAAEIVQLDNRRRKASAQRNQSPEKWGEFYQASVELSSRYNSLAFPRGLNGAYERIDSGDPETIEEAICFLEVRPYFLRSGYMFKDILRKCKHAPLSPKQTARLEVVKEKLAEWKRTKSIITGSIC
jgi:hypothetical protein